MVIMKLKIPFFPEQAVKTLVQLYTAENSSFCFFPNKLTFLL